MVVVLDYNPERLKLAKYAGAELTINQHGDPTAAIMNLSGGRGCDGIVIAAATVVVLHSIRRLRSRVTRVLLVWLA